MGFVDSGLYSLSRSDLVTATTFNNLGYALRQKNDPKASKEAESCYKEAIRIRRYDNFNTFIAQHFEYKSCETHINSILNMYVCEQRFAGRHACGYDCFHE